MEIRIRVAAVNCIKTQWNFYKDFVLSDMSYQGEITSSKEYESLMSTNSEYGGDIELVLLFHQFYLQPLQQPLSWK
jgi:hypothetical protein